MLDKLTINGLTFSVRVVRDEDMREPWKEHDGYGIVSEWVRRDKRPGERVLISYRDSKRYYDVQASTERALADGWGVENPEGKTKRQIAAEAVEQDYQRLRAWCNDEWYWCYVQVRLLDTKGNTVNGFHKSLGGIESDSSDYLMEVARELAEELAAEIGDKREISIAIR